MKRLICICISLILVFSSAAFCFADGEVIKIDRLTGEVITDAAGGTSTYAKLSENCMYDKQQKEYVYSTSSFQNSNVYCSVYADMVTTNTVSLSCDEAANVTVYRDGETVDADNYHNLSTPGYYVVRNNATDNEVFSFTIVKQLTSALYSYNVPGIFYISRATYNGQDLLLSGSTLKLEEDGDYYLSYGCSSTGEMYELNLTIDHTAPNLEIIGPVDGVARSAVSFGPREEKSTIAMYRDGEPIAISDELKTAGDYTVAYTDEAGNTNTYYFTINVFFDGAAWVFVGLIVLTIALAGGYMLYSRKKMRTR